MHINLKKFLNKKINLNTKIVFILIFLFFSIFWYLGYLTFYEIKDNDTYFYIKLAHIYKQKAIVLKEFPWLYNTNLKDNYPGIHFLWSLILLPFVEIFGDINGAKILQSIIVGLIFSSIFLILKEFTSKIFALFFLIGGIFFFPLVGEFLFRLWVVRPIGLSIFFFLLTLFFILKQRVFALFFLNFLFVWAYDGYIVSFILLVLYGICEILIKRKINYFLFLGGIFGILAGNILNPYFPNNLKSSQLLYTNPIVNLAFPISLEWMPVFFLKGIFLWALLGYLIFIIISSSQFLYKFFTEKEKDSQKYTNLFFIYISSYAFLFLTLLSNRFIDYFFPLIVILSSFYIFEFRKFFNFKFLKNFKIKILSLVILVFILNIQFSIVFLKSVEALQNQDNSLKKGFSLVRYSGASNFLKNFSKKGEVVFLDRWDIFPYFFYFNTKNYYNLGLNGNYLLQKDPELFFLHENIVRFGVLCNKYFLYCGEKFICKEKQEEDLGKILKEKFRATYFVLDEKNLKRIQKYFHINYLISQSKHMKLIYQDRYFKEIKIYKIF